MPKDNTLESVIVSGAGGGKGGGSGPTIHSNTLQSNHKVRILELVCEGPVESISPPYLNETAALDADGNPNFDGLTYHHRLGLPDQTPIEGFSSQEADVAVDAIVEQGTPVVRTINDTDTDSVRVQVKIPALFDMDQANGDMLSTDLEFRIQYKNTADTSWIDIPQSPIILEDEKNTSPMFLGYRFSLTGGGPWDVRVVRVTDDSEDNADLSNDLYFFLYTQIIDQKFIYPHSAIAAVEASAQQFGQNLPTRAYLVKGLICDVPTNFDPVTRTYTGIWDGTFKQAWTDCPAWCLYELTQNSRWGLGSYLPEGVIDKTNLYAISQYCAGLVDDGDGGTEPRMTLNAYIGTRREAYDLINALTSVFRGMSYWALGSVMFAQDRPTDPSVLVTRANTVNGEFEYRGGSLKAVHNRVNVTYNNPTDFYKRDVVSVDDPDHILQYGLRPTDIIAFGCTSRSQAIRAGRWLLWTERMESESLTYIGGPDHTDIGPGSVVRVADPREQGGEYGGRVSSTPSSVDIVLDREVVLQSGETYELVLIGKDRELHYRDISNADETTNTLEVTVPLPELPDNTLEAVWTLNRTSGPDTLWRVLNSKEIGPEQFQISAIMYEASKYAIVEEGMDLPGYPAPLLPTGPLPAPLNLRVREYVTDVYGSADVSTMQVSYTAQSDPRIRGYELRWRRKGHSWQRVDMRMDPTYNLNGITDPGRYQFSARSYDGVGNYSQYTGIQTIPVTGTPVNYTLPNVSGVTITPSRAKLALTWTNPELSNYRETRWYINTVNNVNTATIAAAVTGEATTIEGLVIGQAYHLWSEVAVYGQGARTSDKVYQGTGTPSQINASTDIQDGTITADELSDAVNTAIEEAAQSALDDKNDAETAAAAALAAQNLAETAQAQAESARDAADLSEANALNHAATAQTARDNALTAQGLATTAAGDAQAASGLALQYRDASQVAMSASQTAQGLAEYAQGLAEVAQTSSETAQSLAEAAQGLAETAQSAAETAQNAAETSEGIVVSSVASQFIEGFQNDGMYWTSTAYNPVGASGVIGHADGYPIVGVTPVLEFNADDVSARTVYSTSVPPLVANERWKVQVKFRQTEGVLSRSPLQLYVLRRDENLAPVASMVQTATQPTVLGDWVVSEAVFQMPSDIAQGVHLRIGFRTGVGGDVADVYQVEYCKINNVTESYNAADSATAAATSASSAATSATDAGTEAAASQAERVAAQTARAGAETAETNAATSATSASGSQSAAASSATLAANSETAAGNSASASATSASNASSSATDAGTSATTATAQANIATSEAGNAQTYATQAATSATDAEGSSQSAQVSEGVVATSVARTFPSGFEQEDLYWIDSTGGPLDDAGGVAHADSFPEVDGVKVCRFNASDVNQRYVFPKGAGVVYDGSVWRVEAEVRQVAGVLNRTPFKMNIVARDSAMGYIQSVTNLVTFTALDTWVKQSHQLALPDPLVDDKYYIRGGVRSDIGDVADIFEVRYILFADITESTLASGSASAAATSASAASSSATTAGQEAQAAEVARVAAVTAQGGAESAQTSAATSATNADGSASSAASSASDAAGSATTAGNSASAAATSASQASSSASGAATSATASEASRQASETALGGAQSAQSSATQSATDAQGSASAADVSAGIAADASFRALLATAPLNNLGFEAASAPGAGRPEGWMTKGGGSTGFETVLGYMTSVDSASEYASEYSYGTNASGGGAWWGIGKRVKTEEGQDWDIVYKANLTFLGSDPVAIGPDFCGEDDAFVEVVWLDEDGAELSRDYSNSAAYDWVSGGGSDTNGWIEHAPGTFTAPMGAAYAELWIIAADCNNGAMAGGLSNYEASAVGAAASYFDDVRITSPNGEVVQVSGEAITAKQYANAAQSSASTATAQADAAGSSASTATTQAGVATTQAGQASTYASQAATSASTADTSAQAASASEGVAVTTAAQVDRVAADLGPATFESPVTAWITNSTSGSGPITSPSYISDADIITDDVDFGTCYAFPDGGNKTVGPAKRFPFETGKTVYEVVVEYKVVDEDGVGATGTDDDHRIGISVFAGDTVVLGNAQTDEFNAHVVDGVQIATAWIAMDRSDIFAVPTSETGADRHLNMAQTGAPNGAFFHFRQNAGTDDNQVLHVNRFEIRDVTALAEALLARQEAETSASAAATSASTAAASETATGQDASAAQTARTGAETAQSGAEAAQTAAALSQAGATGSASQAASSATLSANSATAADGSATAAGNSATAAGDSATAAEASKNAAVSSATAAASSATTAGTKSNEASQSAGAAQTALLEAQAAFQGSSAQNLFADGKFYASQDDDVSYVEATSGAIDLVFGDDGTYRYAQFTNPANDGYAYLLQDVAQFENFTVFPEGVYVFEISAHVWSDTVDDYYYRVGAGTQDIGGTNYSLVYATLNYDNVAGGWQSISGTVTVTVSAGREMGFFRLLADAVGAAPTTPHTVRWANVSIKNITSEYNADASASAAAADALDASTFADASGVSAGLSETHSLSAEASFTATYDVVKETLPTNFQQDGLFWTKQYSSGDPEQLTDADVGFDFVDTDLGRALEVTGQVSSNQVFAPMGYMVLDDSITDQRVRITVKFRQVSGVAGDTNVAIQVRRYESTTIAGSGTWNTQLYTATALDEWTTVVWEWLVVGADTHPVLKPLVYVGLKDPATSVFEFAEFRIEEVTSEVRAENSASAAVGSASTADTRAGDAESAAAAAETAVTNATTQAGYAATSASNASTSETNASGSAAAALISEGAAVTARDTSIEMGYQIGTDNFKGPRDLWTLASTSSGVFPKNAVPEAYIVDNPIFGKAFEIDVTNYTVGPAMGATFGRSRSYLITVQWIVMDLNGGTDTSTRVGFSTFSDNGATMQVSNQQVVSWINPADANVVHTKKVLFKPDTVTDLGDFDRHDETFDHTSASDLSTMIAFHFRANNGSGNDATVHLGLFQIEDVTGELNANISAKASFDSAATATAKAGDAGEAATTATTQAGYALTSAGNAATSEGNAATSETNAGISESAAADYSRLAAESHAAGFNYNLAKNGTFRDDLELWDTVNVTNGTATHSVATSTDKPTLGALVLTSDSTLWANITQDHLTEYDIPVGTVFRASGWVRDVTGDVGGHIAYIGLQFKRADGTTTSGNVSGWTDPLTSAWVNQQGEYTTTEAFVAVRVQLVLDPDENGGVAGNGAMFSDILVKDITSESSAAGSATAAAGSATTANTQASNASTSASASNVSYLKAEAAFSSATTKNLVRNGDGADLTGDIADFWSNDANLTIIYDVHGSATPRNSTCIRATLNDGTDEWAQVDNSGAPIDGAVASRKFRLNIALWCSSIGWDVFIGLRVGLDDDTHTHSGQYVASQTTFQQHEIEFTVASNAVNFVPRLIMSGAGMSTGDYILFTDFSIVDITEEDAASGYAAEAEGWRNQSVDAQGFAEDAQAAAELAEGVVVATEARQNFQQGLTNASFEMGTDLQAGPPTGWLADSDGAGYHSAGTKLTYHTGAGLFNDSATTGSQTSYGANSTDAGPWWYIAKRVRCVPGQQFNTAFYVWMNSVTSFSTTDAVGTTCIGEDDAYNHFIWYDEDGEFISQSLSNGVNHTVNNNLGYSMSPGTWYLRTPFVLTAPANAAFLELRYIAADGNGAAFTNAQRYDYSGFTGNASVLFDDISITSSNGSVIEVTEAEWNGNLHRVEAGVSEASAVQAASDANDYSAAAEFARDVAVRSYTGGAYDNPIFQKWSGTWPDGVSTVYLDEGNAWKNTTEAKYENCLYLATLGSPTQNRPMVRWNSNVSEFDLPIAEDCTSVQVDLELTLQDGAWEGTLLRCTWMAGGSGGSNGYDQVFVQEELPDAAVGIVNQLQVVFERPTSFASGTSDGYVRIEFYTTTSSGGYTRAYNQTLIHRMDVKALNTNAVSSMSQRAAVGVSGIQASAFGLRTVAGAAEAEFELVSLDDPGGVSASAIRASADNILLDGSVNARHMTIEDMLTLDADEAAFVMGKNNASDYASDGMYLGRNTDQSGGTGFAFFAGRTDGGEEQYIRITKDDGLTLKNAVYHIGSGAPDAAVNVTTTQTVTLSTSKALVSLMVVGGGGGGAGLTTDGSNGGVTTVVLLDDTTPIKTWTAGGGDGGAGASSVTVAPHGQEHPYGTGGDGHVTIVEGDKGDTYTDRKDYGSNGAITNVSTWDISGLTTPKLQITIGSGGAKGTGGTVAQDGADGLVQYTTYEDTELDGYVLASEPLVQGTFTVTNGDTNVLFPATTPGRGLWLLDNCPRNMTITPCTGFSQIMTHTVYGNQAGAITFVANSRPAYSISSSATSTVVRYTFWPMG